MHLFSSCRRDRGCVDPGGIWFVFCYRHHKRTLSVQMVRRETNLKQLCISFLSEKGRKYLFHIQVICFIICYCGFVSDMDFSLSLFSLNRCPISAATSLASVLLAELPVLLGCWSASGRKWLRNAYHS